MHIIVIHGHFGDTVALVARLAELDAMNLMYTEIPLDSKLPDQLSDPQYLQLKQDLAQILGIHIDKSLVGL